jgi:hypothetical protein
VLTPPGRNPGGQILGIIAKVIYVRMNDMIMWGSDGVAWRGVNVPLKRSVGGPRRAIFFLSHSGDTGGAKPRSPRELESTSCKRKSGGKPTDGRGARRFWKTRSEVAAKTVPTMIRRLRREELNLWR